MTVRAGLRLAGILVVALCSCTAIEHNRELEQAREDLDEATGLRAEWQVDTPLRAFTLPPSGELTEEEALELALANNRALRASVEMIGQAKAELVQAGLLSNPMLSVMLRFPESGGRAAIDFGLVKDFADLWLIPSRRRAARSMLRQRLLALTDAAVDLVREVRTTYARLRYYEAAVELQVENLEILGQAIDVAEARLRAGSATQLDVNLLDARRLQGELDLLETRNARRTAQLELLRLMGVPATSTDWRPTPLPEDVAAVELPEETLVDWGLDRRLDIVAAGWEVDAALAEFEQETLRLFPSFSLGVSGERFERRAAPGRNIAADTARASIANGRLTAPEIEPRSARRAERRRELDFVLGPTLELPLPIFDQNQAQIAKAQYRVRELHERYCGLEQQVVENIRTALTTLQTARKRRQIFVGALLPLQQSNLQVAEAAYQSGQHSILAVLLAQQDLVQTRLGLAAALRDEIVGSAALARQVGGRLPRPDELQAAAAASQPSTPETHKTGDEP